MQKNVYDNFVNAKTLFLVIHFLVLIQNFLLEHLKKEDFSLIQKKNPKYTPN